MFYTKVKLSEKEIKKIKDEYLFVYPLVCKGEYPFFDVTENLQYQAINGEFIVTDTYLPPWTDENGTLDGSKFLLMFSESDLLKEKIKNIRRKK